MPEVSEAVVSHDGKLSLCLNRSGLTTWGHVMGSPDDHFCPGQPCQPKFQEATRSDTQLSQVSLPRSRLPCPSILGAVFSLELMRGQTGSYCGHHTTCWMGRWTGYHTSSHVSILGAGTAVWPLPVGTLIPVDSLTRPWVLLYYRGVAVTEATWPLKSDYWQKFALKGLLGLWGRGRPP